MTRLTVATLAAEFHAEREEQRAVNATLIEGLSSLLAASGVTAEAPARSRKAGAPKATTAKAKAPKAKAAPAPELKTLTRGVWKRIRVTKGGVVRKAFVGLTREQAFEAGLCEGYRLPSGEMRKALANG